MLERLIAVVGEYVPVDRQKIDYNTSLRMDLGLNSLDLVNLAVSVENEFGIEISDRKLAMMKTVGDLVRHIETTAE
ncbi:MAG: acyl carrier protein [Clostridia bacterium]|nr:acyl carrier protein [Clostridia bacterium]MBR2414831.1 acyl carrier protein [Clostridia bacterium]MBR3956030.1 acyl carrier protein [Clostridia bacterium]